METERINQSLKLESGVKNTFKTSSFDVPMFHQIRVFVEPEVFRKSFLSSSQVEHILNDRLLQFVNIDLHDVT
ncbi:hypothetical protein L1887_05000 [Cichorium endivia]|nr:hypothetical protein L1887_05000 [Cichorium endivia]